MAYLAYMAGISPREYDEMEPHFTRRYVGHIRKFREADVELQVTLAKFAAGASLSAGPAEEVR